MAVAPLERPHEPVLLGADQTADPVWQRRRYEALQCAQAALTRREPTAGTGGWGLLALAGAFLGIAAVRSP